ncbi:MAG: RNase adapter RapZ [Rhodospirillaceae bacterium]|nr:RNase adapter RapZ [Rhodospirillaceae bacterium]
MSDSNHTEISLQLADKQYSYDKSKVVVITGLSGAGKSLALKSLEDLGYEAIDNIPLSLLIALIRLSASARPLAIGIDIRTRDFNVTTMLAEIDHLVQKSSIELSLLFLISDDTVLCRRFKETRRRHPLAPDRPLLDGIRHERKLISPLEKRADLVIDTSALHPSKLKRVLCSHFKLTSKPSMIIFVISFSYRNGLPREADLIFDVRFLDNPHYVEILRPLTGRDEQVVKYVSKDPDFSQFFEVLTTLLKISLPRFIAESRSYLTIAIGCTGGKHRSVVVSEKLTNWLREQDQQVDLWHRELEAM